MGTECWRKIQMSKIGFIGLGNMGFPMATNIFKAGHSLSVFDAAPAALEKAASAGMTACVSAAASAIDADFIVTMLPNGEIALSVLDEIVHAAKTGAVIIDSSTIDVASAKNAHAIATEAGLLL